MPLANRAYWGREVTEPRFKGRGHHLSTGWKIKEFTDPQTMRLLRIESNHVITVSKDHSMDDIKYKEGGKKDLFRKPSRHGYK